MHCHAEEMNVHKIAGEELNTIWMSDCIRADDHQVHPLIFYIVIRASLHMPCVLCLAH